VSTIHSTVISMRLPVESGKRLKRMARRHGWTASDASARLVEEGLRRAEFAFIDFREAARPAFRAAHWLFGKSQCSCAAIGETQNLWHAT